MPVRNNVATKYLIIEPRENTCDLVKNRHITLIEDKEEDMGKDEKVMEKK